MKVKIILKHSKYSLKIYSNHKGGNYIEEDKNKFYDNELAQSIKEAKFFKQHVNIKAIKFKKPYIIFPQN